MEHSLLRLPETDLFPEKENVSLVARKKKKMIPRLLMGEPEPSLNVAGI